MIRVCNSADIGCPAQSRTAKDRQEGRARDSRRHAARDHRPESNPGRCSKEPYMGSYQGWLKECRIDIIFSFAQLTLLFRTVKYKDTECRNNHRISFQSVFPILKHNLVPMDWTPLQWSFMYLLHDKSVYYWSADTKHALSLYHSCDLTLLN